MELDQNKKCFRCCSGEEERAELQQALLRLRHHFHRHHHSEFQRYHRYFRYARPAGILFNIAVFYLLFTWVGFQTLGILLAVLIGIKEIVQFFMLLRFEKRILAPVEELKRGVDQIANGNYNVQIEGYIPNDLGLLIASFNEMARNLAQTEKMKAEYEDNRKALIANISHDLKTPITAIQGHIEALLDHTAEAGEAREKYLKVIYHNVAYLNKLIDDLFLFSKLDMEKLDFHFEKTRIREYLADLMEEYQLEFSDQNIKFQYSDSLDSEPDVNIDGKRLFQAINNIIRNAVKYGPPDLSLTVTLYRSGDRLGLDIQDNGPGIPRDKLPFIFDRFYRIDTERTKDLESTGLGLAIAKELVKAHGGEIFVTTQEPGGTCFTITLPLARNDEDGLLK